MALTEEERKERKRAGNRAYMKKFRKENPELMAARNKASYEKHKETRAKSSKAYRDANVEKLKAKSKKYRDANGDVIRQKKKIYAENNRDKINAQKKVYYLKTRILHPLPLLPEGESKRRHAIKGKQWYLNNLDECKRKEKRRSIDLQDSYVRKLLTVKTSLKPKDIPQELIEFKRQSIILKRTIKEIQKCRQ